MATNYDPIAKSYKASKMQPWRIAIEGYSFLNLIGDVQGKTVLDLACGEGHYTRKIKQRGASRVTGVDLSSGMIALAKEQESADSLGIDYLCGDARFVECPETFDLVVCAYLLNYAQKPQDLVSMCQGIARNLKPGGRFVTVNASPLIYAPKAPSYRKYGFELKASEPRETGAPIRWVFHQEAGTFEIENYFLDSEIHSEAFRESGLIDLRWWPPQLDPDNHYSADTSFWDLFLRESPIILIEAAKG